VHNNLRFVRMICTRHFRIEQPLTSVVHFKFGPFNFIYILTEPIQASVSFRYLSPSQIRFGTVWKSSWIVRSEVRGARLNAMWCDVMWWQHVVINECMMEASVARQWIQIMCTTTDNNSLQYVDNIQDDNLSSSQVYRFMMLCDRLTTGCVWQAFCNSHEGWFSRIQYICTALVW